jgi:hypothetical protein
MPVSHEPQTALNTKTDRLTDRQSQCDSDCDWVEFRVEAGSNISTVTLRVVGGEEEGSLKSESPKGLGPEKDYAGEGQQHIKRQTRPLVRDWAPQKQDRNCQRIINIWSWAPDGARARHQDLLIDWPSVAMWLWLDFDLMPVRRWKEKSQIWDSKIWSRVPRISNPRKTRLARTISIYKTDQSSRQRGLPRKQDRNCQRIINIW